MRLSEPEELIIEIDDRIAAIIEEINAAPNDQSNIDLVEAGRDVIIDSIVGPFGLSGIMFDDRDGGNITTVHNFKKGIVATESDARRYENYVRAQTEPVDRSDYEAGYRDMRKSRFKQSDPIYDDYTGQMLPKDGRAHIDHIVSVSEIERSPKAHLAQSREERVATANMTENLAWTRADINQSKQDRRATEWANMPNRKDPSRTNAEIYGVDPRRISDKERSVNGHDKMDINGHEKSPKRLRKVG